MHTHVTVPISSAGHKHWKMVFAPIEKDAHMNFRRLSKAVAAALLAVGIVTAGVAPATAAPRHSSTNLQDTGWGFK